MLTIILQRLLHESAYPTRLLPMKVDTLTKLPHDSGYPDSSFTVLRILSACKQILFMKVDTLSMKVDTLKVLG